MNIVLWILAGGVIGWAGIAFLGFNEMRGKIVSIIIGMAGGLVGGKVLAPMFGAAAAIPGDFSMMALMVALLGAAACLAIANMVHNRFGV